jgi:hypothetical protein
MKAHRANIKLLSLMLFLLSGNFSLDRLPCVDISMEVKWIFLGLVCFLNIVLGPPRVCIGRAPCLFMLSVLLFMVPTFGSMFYAMGTQSMIVAFVDHLLIVATTFLTFVCSSAYLSKRLLLEYVARFFTYVSALYSVVIVVTSLMTSGRGSILIGGPNVATRIVFFGAMTSLYLFSQKKQSKYLGLSVFYLISVVLLGSRGGIVGACVTIALVIAIKIVSCKAALNVKNVYRTLVPVIISSSVLVMVLYDEISKVFRTRVIEQLIRSQYTAGRDVLYSKSIGILREHLIIGAGLGSYYETLRTYPHNLFLEVLLNSGVVGLALFMPVLVYGLILPYRTRHGDELLLGVLPFYMIVVQNFSGGIYDFRYYFFWVALLLAVRSSIRSYGTAREGARPT